MIKNQPGFYLPLILTFSAIIIIVTGGILTLAYSNFSLVKNKANSNSALSVSEAGINYYLWHLAHNDTDYCDGNSGCTGSGPFGPFIHNYFDASGAPAGSFSLKITPPTTNGATVMVESEGTTLTGQKRTVVATLGIPSFAQYSFVTNSEAWFGNTESTNGLVHSNKGIHFDGTANGVVSAAVQTYSPSSCFGGDGQTKNGVWGTGGPQTYWNYPVPSVNFSQITSDLNTLQLAAQLDGLYLPTLVDDKGKKTFSGYALQLNANGTLTVGRVTGKQDTGGTNSACVKHSSNTSLIQNVQWEDTARQLPANGVIFVADNVWVWGTVASRLTIASGRLPDTPSTNTNVFLQNDISYTAHDGSVALGIIGQSDIVVNSDSENDLVLDAFLLSQKGKVFQPFYPGTNCPGASCSTAKNQITIYGGIASNSWWTWSWVNGSNNIISGYRTTNQTYDTYLTLNPPPLFPKTGSFAILSWKEQPIL